MTKSVILREITCARQIYVYTPFGYTPSGESYSLVVLFDGIHATNRVFCHTLQQKGYLVHESEFAGAHEPHCFCGHFTARIALLARQMSVYSQKFPPNGCILVAKHMLP